MMNLRAVLGLLLVILILSAVSPWPAAAAEGGEHAGPGWRDTIGQFFNLFVLFGLIFYFVREPLRQFFADRGSRIQQDIRDAAGLASEAEQKLAEIHRKLENIEQELSTIRAEVDREVDLERQRLLGEGGREVERILAVAAREIEGLTLAARKELQVYAADLAVRLAEQHIRREMNRTVEAHLFEYFFAQLTSVKAR